MGLGLAAWQKGVLKLLESGETIILDEANRRSLEKREIWRRRKLLCEEHGSLESDTTEGDLRKTTYKMPGGGLVMFVSTASRNA